MRGIKHQIQAGDRFGNLTVLATYKSKFIKSRDLLLQCSCDCGRATAIVRSTDLIRSKITSCRRCRDEETKKQRLALSRRSNPMVDYSKPIPASTSVTFRVSSKDGPIAVHVPDLNDLRKQIAAQPQKQADAARNWWLERRYQQEEAAKDYWRSKRQPQETEEQRTERLRYENELKQMQEEQERRAREWLESYK